MAQIFVSHTKKDVQFCDKFDRIFAREEKIKAFRSEFEAIESPAWTTIKNAINNSVALVLLVGEGLVNNQKANVQDSSWKFTQNWIAFEIGIACQKGIDVWAVCDKRTEINFPMPYITNYVTTIIDSEYNFSHLRNIFKEYGNYKRYTHPYRNYENYKWKNFSITCPYEDCSISFNLMQECIEGETITCPQCLRKIFFDIKHPWLS